MGLRVICVGAGVASLSSAIALREHAESITLLEAADSIESMNVRAAGLAIYTCGANILRDTLGLDPIHDIHAVQGQAIRAVSWKDGSPVREFAPPSNDWYMAHRGSLLDALLNKAVSSDAKGKPAELLMKKSVTEIDVEAGKVTTEDGSVYEGDIIIGGDGVRSITRKAIVDEAIVQPSGLSVYRWTMKPEDWQHLPNKEELDALFGYETHILHTSDSEDTRLIFYRCHASGIINGGLILPDYRLPHTSEDWTTSGSIEHLRSAVADLGGPLKDAVSCVKSCGLWQLRKQAPLRTWCKGKAIILGDAAHPMLPFQAAAGALAMEDAEALQYSLRQVNWDPKRVPEALERTFCLRFLRCSMVQHFSNASPFSLETMQKAAAWSLERVAASSADSVPLVREGAADKVQQVIAQKIEESAGVFDVRGTSVWVMNYTSAEEFAKDQPAYILDETFV